MRNLITPLLATSATVLILAVTSAHADLGDQLTKLLADDGAAFDLFGYSVGISGSPGREIAIVGSRRDDDNGNSSGSAYLFDIATGQQIFKLLPDDGAVADAFGWSVGISGTTAIVGAPGNEGDGSGSGSAYLFDTTTGLQIAKLFPNDGGPGDSFGESVAISGSIAIVGANRDDDACPGFIHCNSGSAYLFDTTTGMQIAKLVPNDTGLGARFGISVAINGSTAIVGAHRDSDNDIQTGSAYLFDATTGKQLAKLLPDDGEEDDWFGRSVAISDTPELRVAIIGAMLDDDDDTGLDAGSAYLFSVDTGQQIAKLLPDEGYIFINFGISCAISCTPGKETVIVGAANEHDNGYQSGSAYLFDAITGKRLAKLLPNDGSQEDWFGWSVGISGDYAVIGATHNDENGSDSGAAYLFQATCPWDMHGDGHVGLGDLLILLGWWGFDPGGPPDFDHDGIVGTTDLLELLAHWGPCV